MCNSDHYSTRREDIVVVHGEWKCGLCNETFRTYQRALRREARTDSGRDVVFLYCPFCWPFRNDEDPDLDGCATFGEPLENGGSPPGSYTVLTNDP